MTCEHGVDAMEDCEPCREVTRRQCYGCGAAVKEGPVRAGEPIYCSECRATTWDPLVRAP